METAVLTASNTIDEQVEATTAAINTCGFCKRLGEDVAVDQWLKKIDAHLIITVSDYGTKDEHYHIHGCVDNNKIMLKMMECIKNEIYKQPKK